MGMTTTDLVALLGATLFVGGHALALRRVRHLGWVLGFSGVAELGFALMGWSAGETAALGGGMHLVYQVVIRSLVILTAARLAGTAGAWTLDALRGAGRLRPLDGVAFGFGVFSLLGVSPFKGALSRFVVIYGFAEKDLWSLALLGTLGSLLFLVYAIRWIQVMCLEAPSSSAGTGPKPSQYGVKPSTVLIVVLVAATALINFFPEPVASMAAWALGSHAHVPHAEGPWPTIAIIPYLGGFAMLALGFGPRIVRDGAAVLLAGGTWILALTSTPIDPVSRFFAILFSSILFLVAIYAVAYMRHHAGARYFFFFFFLMAGSLMGIASCQELGSFFLFWELMTWSSYLLAVHTRTPAALKAGARYFIMCSAGAYLMHLGLIWLGLEAGTFSLTELKEASLGLSSSARYGIAALLIAGFAVKAALLPVHSWLPLVDPAAPTPLAASSSAILTKASLAGMLKIVVVVVGFDTGWASTAAVLSMLGIASLLFAEVMAWRQTDTKRMLAYSSMAQVAEIFAVLGVATPIAMASAHAHVLAHGITKTLLWLAVGAFAMRGGSNQLESLRGLGRSMPVTSLCLLVGAFGIMGLPPFVGFSTKFFMVYASVDAGQIHVAVALLVGGFLSVLYYGRLVRWLVLEPAPHPQDQAQEVPWAMRGSMLILAVLVLGLGLFPQPVYALALEASRFVFIGSGPVLDAVPALLPKWPLASAVCAGGALFTLLWGRAHPARAGLLAGSFVFISLMLVPLEFDDALSRGFALLVAGLGFANLIYSIGYFSTHPARSGRFFGAFAVMVAGLLGMAGANDLFSFFFFWELMSSWALYLAIVHDETEDALREGFKYFTFNMAGASFLFLGVAILASSTQSLEFAALSASASELSGTQLAFGLGLSALGFSMKAAMLTVRVDVQMHPATAPTPISGYISAVLLKSGPLAAFKLIQLFGGGVLVAQLGSLLGPDPVSYMLAVVGAVTALSAALMAMIQTGIKRLLIYSTVAQLGYIMTGLALGDPLSTAGGLAHLINHALLKNTLFLCAGAILCQAHISSLNDLGGLARRMPQTFACFCFAGLSLSGIPPLNGLASKWLIYGGALSSGHPFLALMLLGASLGTLAAILKFIHAAFLGAESTAARHLREPPLSMRAPMVFLVFLSIALSLFPGFLLVPVAEIQAALGITPIEVTLFGPLPGPHGWHPAVVGLALAAPAAVAARLLTLNPVIYTHAHTCGVDIDPRRVRVEASHLYSAPKRLLRAGLVRRR